MIHSIYFLTVPELDDFRVLKALEGADLGKETTN